MVSFGWPLAFLLLPLPLILALAGRNRAPASPLRVPPALAEAMDAEGSSGRRPPARLLLPALVWTALVTGIAQPGIISGEQVAPASGRALELVIDLSGSMEKRDFVIGGQVTDRLAAVKTVAGAFLTARQGDRVGLVLFGEEAFSASPVSFDRASVAHALGESAIGMAGRTTAIGEALGLAIVKLRDDPAPERAIILLSDGTNNSGSAEPEDAARLAAENRIRIHAIGLGSERADAAGDPIDPSADLDEKTLREVAEASGGTFFRARTTEELKAAYDAIDALEGGKAPAPPFVPRQDLTGYAIAAMLVLLGLALAAAWREERA
ncbi:MAG: VWA domain-containing protein [Notoacmeibacter sp.]|nr:VWA domain-containing protein [Notoacmeibacter sp.]